MDKKRVAFPKETRLFLLRPFLIKTHVKRNTAKGYN